MTTHWTTCILFEYVTFIIKLLTNKSQRWRSCYNKNLQLSSPYTMGLRLANKCIENGFHNIKKINWNNIPLTNFNVTSIHNWKVKDYGSSLKISKHISMYYNQSLMHLWWQIFFCNNFVSFALAYSDHYLEH